MKINPGSSVCFKKKLGFSLVEFLVVIAIVMILAAILFPVFIRVRENARRASCQSNLKQIGLGFAQYAQDYGAKYPVLRGGPTGDSRNGVFVLLQPYLSNVQIYRCPSGAAAPGTDPTNGDYSDYAYNIRLGYDFRTFSNRGLSTGAITQSALTILACDYPSGSSDSWSDGHGNNGLATFPAGATQRHLETQNFLFCDGHIKAIKGQDTMTSAGAYGDRTPGTTSLNSPTFNPYV